MPRKRIDLTGDAATPLRIGQRRDDLELLQGFEGLGRRYQEAASPNAHHVIAVLLAVGAKVVFTTTETVDRELACGANPGRDTRTPLAGCLGRGRCPRRKQCQIVRTANAT